MTTPFWRVFLKVSDRGTDLALSHKSKRTCTSDSIDVRLGLIIFFVAAKAVASARLPFLPSDPEFAARTAAVNLLLQQWPIVGGSGSWLEAHFMARATFTMGQVHVIGTCITADEVFDLIRSRSDRCLLVLVDSIAADHGEELVSRLQKLPVPPAIVLMVAELDWLRPESYPVHQVDALIHTHSFGTGALINGLKALAKGECYMDPAILTMLWRTDTTPRPQLTSRERTVLRGLGNGLTNRQIAERLGLAESTVRDYVRSLLAKFQARNRTLVVCRAIELGLLAPAELE